MFTRYRNPMNAKIPAIQPPIVSQPFIEIPLGLVIDD